MARDNTPWMAVAEAEMGVKEVPGSGDNPRIVEYHGATDGGESPDEVPWCSSFACWCMEQVGIRSPRSKAAKDWRMWGQEIEYGEFGCIVVMMRPGGNHVGFYTDEDDDGVLVLGGNQSDAVNIKHFAWDRITNFRMPA